MVCLCCYMFSEYQVTHLLLINSNYHGYVDVQCMPVPMTAATY